MVKKIIKIIVLPMAFSLLIIINPVAADTGAKSPVTKEKANMTTDVKKGEAAGASETDKLQAATIEPVNINKADVKTLTTLKGIGKDRAQKIVEYREKNGPFQKPEDLMKVKGIGKKIFDQNKDFILI
jgi:competence protein ComEA